MTANELMDKIRLAYKAEDVACIRFALDFATKAHSDQKRISGEPYIVHPINVAGILVELGMDAGCVSAALLHDVLEDTDCTEREFRRKFGEEIFKLVEGVTKLSRIKFHSREEEQAENYRKMFFAIAEDVRVLFIKLADRLHNMRTLDALRPDKQIRIAQETLDLYAPLAGRLGISGIKCEMEDLTMKYLHPEEYRFLRETIDKRRGERMGLVMRVAFELEVQLKELGIQGEVKGRPKHLYSIYKKMKNQNKTLDQIYDLVAVRVIVRNVRECYTVLGIIHSTWKPIPGRFKDYIAMPKPNLYQSLHTTVMTNFGQIFEIQIRTYEMNRIAEYGIAAHWKYKEGKTSSEPQSDFDSKLGWIKEMMDVGRDIKDSQEFLSTLKLNIGAQEIYVFTPKGDVFSLPPNATCVDFAYKIHSAVGNKCTGAKLNNKIVPLDTVLSTGDVVEILTSSAAKGPSRDWLKFVTTPAAKSKIKNFFKKELQEENIKTGRDMLEREAKRRGFNLSELMAVQSGVNNVLMRYGLANIDEIFASVGYGGITTNQVLLKLVDSYNKQQALTRPSALVGDMSTELSKTPQGTGKKTRSGVIVEGFGDFLIKLAHCCNPVPGDEIVGYAARGTGVSIHRTDCPNIANMEKERLMRAVWAGSESTLFTAQLVIECQNKNGILNQITGLIAAERMNIASLETHAQEREVARITLGIQIKNISDLEYIMKKIETIPAVTRVRRGH